MNAAALYRRLTGGGGPHWRLLRAVVRWSAVMYRQLRRDRAFERAGAMAYTTLVAVVPMLVLVFGVLRGTTWLGYGESRITQVQDLLFGTFLADIPEVREFLAEGLLRLDLGALGAAGVLAVVAIAARLYLMVEQAYNEIFGVPITRGFGLRLLNFYFTLTMVPIAMALGLASVAEARVPLSTEALGALLQFVVLLVALRAFPCTRVKWRAALAGATVSLVLLQIAGRLVPLYLRFVASEDPLQVIYGSLALLPVFLLWLFLLWLVVLLGVEVAFVTQNFSSLVQAEVEQWEESHHVLRAPSIDTALEALAVVAWSYEAGHGPVSVERLARTVQLRARDLGGVLRVLERGGFIVRTDDDAWVLARPPSAVRVGEVVDAWRRLTSSRSTPDSPVALEVTAALRTRLSGTLADALERWIDDDTVRRAEEDLFSPELPADRATAGS